MATPQEDGFGSRAFMAASAKRRRLAVEVEDARIASGGTDTDPVRAKQQQLQEAAHTVDAAIEAFILDEVAKHATRSQVMPDRSNPADGFLDRLRKALTFSSPASQLMLNEALEKMQQQQFCTSLGDESVNLTAAQQAVFACTNPLLCGKMPSFAVAAQPGAGKTLMSLLACVRWVLGGAAERRYYDKSATETTAPRPFLAQGGQFVRPSSATCLYVVPRAVLPQTIDNFTRYSALFGLEFSVKPLRSIDLLYRYEDAEEPTPLVPGANTQALFHISECEEYWFAPMSSWQWAPFQEDSLQRRIYGWDNDPQHFAQQRASFPTGIDFQPAVLRYKDEYQLRIAFTPLEALLRDNLNQDAQTAVTMTVEQYFAREKEAAFTQGLQILATPRVRYVVVDEFHMPLEQVAIEGAPTQGFFAHPGASNLLNLIGTKAVNGHVFCDPMGSRVPDMRAALDAATYGGIARDIIAKATVACTQTALAVGDLQALVANSARREGATLHTTFGWLKDPTNRPMVRTHRQYCTQTLMMTGTPPGLEATALWAALAQPDTKLMGTAEEAQFGGQHEGGFHNQARNYGSDANNLFVDHQLVPAFFWRYSRMTRSKVVRCTKDPKSPYTTDSKTAPTLFELDPEVGEIPIGAVCPDPASYVNEAAKRGCVIAFVGSRQTTPYWHYEFVRGRYPVFSFTEQLDAPPKLIGLSPNGPGPGVCADLAGQARKGAGSGLYNTMLYGGICPTRVVPTDSSGLAVELEDWQSVWRTIRRVLDDLHGTQVLIDPGPAIATAYPSVPQANWADWQLAMLARIKQQPRVCLVYAGPAAQWPVFLDSVPDDDAFGGIGWLAPQAFASEETLSAAVEQPVSTGGGMLQSTPPDGFMGHAQVSHALQMGVKLPAVNLFLLNTHDSTGIDLPHINVVLYVGDEGNKEQMFSRSSRLCKPMAGVDPAVENTLGSFVVIQILPEAVPYRFTDQSEADQRSALTIQGVERCFQGNCP